MNERVGPVLIPGASSEAVIAVIRERYPDTVVEDRGSYLRVSRLAVCELARADVEARLGESFPLPSALEAIMPSFQGRLEVSHDRVVWRWRA
jgi:hypothetical protein